MQRNSKLQRNKFEHVVFIFLYLILCRITFRNRIDYLKCRTCLVIALRTLTSKRSESVFIYKNVT